MWKILLLTTSANSVETKQGPISSGIEVYSRKLHESKRCQETNLIKHVDSEISIVIRAFGTKAHHFRPNMQSFLCQYNGIYGPFSSIERRLQHII